MQGDDPEVLQPGVKVPDACQWIHAFVDAAGSGFVESQAGQANLAPALHADDLLLAAVLGLIR